MSLSQADPLKIVFFSQSDKRVKIMPSNLQSLSSPLIFSEAKIITQHKQECANPNRWDNAGTGDLTIQGFVISKNVTAGIKLFLN